MATNTITLQSPIRILDIQNFMRQLSSPGSEAGIITLASHFSTVSIPAGLLDFVGKSMTIQMIDSKSYSSGPVSNSSIPVGVSGDLVNNLFTAVVIDGGTWLSVTVDNSNPQILVSCTSNPLNTTRTGRIRVRRSANLTCSVEITIYQAGAETTTTTTTLAPPPPKLEIGTI